MLSARRLEVVIAVIVVVLDQVTKSLAFDPTRVYLTGHSMGGHGTWILGSTYPDRFGAIGPSAGWISFWSYREIGRAHV